MKSKGKHTDFIKKIKNIIDKINIICLAIFTLIISLALSKKTEKIITYTFFSKEAKENLLKLVDYANIIKELVPIKCLLYLLFVVIILIWMLKVYFYFIYKEPVGNKKKIIHIMAHSSKNKSQFKLNKSLLEEHEIDINEIDLVDEMNNINNNYKKINYIVSVQDSNIENFKNKINDNDRYGYMGIAHTPLIVRAGYKIGDETRFVLFHKKRNIDVDYYDELDYSEEYKKIKIEKIKVNKDSRELIVAISTTFQIKDEDLGVFAPDKKSVLKFCIENLENSEFDVIKSYKQVNEYITTILKEIRRIKQENNITKVHMVISSSVAFTFALGQALSSNYDPEIIVYHYDSNSPDGICYPWGISIFKNCEDCVVINSLENNKSVNI